MESLILIADYIIAFSCFTISELNFSPSCPSVGEATWSASSTLKTRAQHLAKSALPWAAQPHMHLLGWVDQESSASNQRVEYAVIMVSEY